MFGRKCSSPGYGFVSKILFFLVFFGSLEREPSLWENTWPWEILRIWESFPGIRLGNQDLWGGEKESTFDTGRRVETGTYHWEGRKPFIQTFEYLLSGCMMDRYILYPYIYIYIIYTYYIYISLSIYHVSSPDVPPWRLPGIARPGVGFSFVFFFSRGTGTGIHRHGRYIWLEVQVYLPLWKIWKSVGVIIPNIYGKKMFQTTNHIYN